MNIIIVAGGSLDAEQLKSIYAENNNPFVIGVDRGSILAMNLGVMPDICIGDFDSISQDEKERIIANSSVEELNPIKDDTDTEHALFYALEKHPDKIILMGCTGTRLDQTIASIRLLRLCYDAGVQAVILDKHNRIRIGKDKTVIKKDDSFGKYVSVIPYGNEANGLTETGFKYEVEDFTLRADISRGISNELKDDVGIISCKDYVIIMESVD